MALNLDSNNNWLVNVDAAGTYTLATTGKYLDRNIAVKVPSSGTPKATKTDMVSYTVIDNVQLVDSDGNAGVLYIDPGYTSGFSLSLDSLLPDFDSAVDGTSAQILEGYKAYDDTGKQIVGTLKTLNPNTSYYTSTQSEGISDSALGSGNLKTAYYVKKGTASISGGGLTDTKDFSKTDLDITQTAAAGGGMAIGTASTTVPSSGYYVSVSASTPEITGITTVSRAAVSELVTAGWITEIEGAISTDTCNSNVSVNAASKTTYVPIATGTCTVDGGGLSITGASIEAPETSMSLGNGTNINNSTETIATYTTSKPESGYYIEITASTKETGATASATRAAITTEQTAGYIPQKDLGTIIDSDTKAISVSVSAGSKTGYISLEEGSCTIEGGGLAVTTIGALSISGGTGVTVLDKAPSGSYYSITASAAESTVSRDAITDEHTAGYISAKSKSTYPNLGSTSVNVAPSDKTYYLSQQTYGVINSNSTNSTVELADGSYVPTGYQFKTTNNGYNVENAVVATVATYLGEITYTA